MSGQGEQAGRDGSVSSPPQAGAHAAGAGDVGAVGRRGPLARVHPAVRYSVLRLLLLLAVGAVLYVLGARGVLLAVLALAVSGVVSIVVLDRQREAMGARVGGFFGRLNQRIEDSKRAEDED